MQQYENDIVLQVDTDIEHDNEHMCVFLILTTALVKAQYLCVYRLWSAKFIPDELKEIGMLQPWEPYKLRTETESPNSSLL